MGGFASTLTPVVQVIFGYVVGQHIQQKGKTCEMLSNLLHLDGCMNICVRIFQEILEMVPYCIHYSNCFLLAYAYMFDKRKIYIKV
jgi:hypothetical protein